MTYYNTTNETGKALEVNTKKALSQEERVKQLFRLYIQWTPSALHLIHFGNSVPLTSIRRAFSNLTHPFDPKETPFLIKTDKKSIGPYGRPEHIYQLNNL